MSLADEFARLAEAAAPPHDNSLEAKNTRWAVYDFTQAHRDEIARALRLARIVTTPSDEDKEVLEAVLWSLGLRFYDGLNTFSVKSCDVDAILSAVADLARAKETTP